MTEQQLHDLGPALSNFLDDYLFCCSYTQTFAHLNTYVRGLLSDLPRKSVEPIAIQAGTPVRTLQEFLKDHLWDFAAVRTSLQQRAADVLPSLPNDPLGTVGLIDETSVAKQGTKTPGIQRQYLGCVGKIENGIVTVHLGVCKGYYKTLIDADLFLPESWSSDRKRCREAGIPHEVVYRPKWQIALEQIDRATANKIHLNWLTFDEAYGASPGFIAGLDSRHLLFVGEVPRTFSCLAAHCSGRRPPEECKGRHAEDVVRTGSVFRSQPWQVMRLARKTLCDQVWRVKAERVWLSSCSGWSAATYWLIWASNDETGEEKFFLSNAPADASLEVLVRVAFRRANVEHGFRVCKSELGFSHFEGRNYVALMRHLNLCLVAMNFVAEHTERLRGEKSGDHDGAGMPGAARTEPVLAPAATGNERIGKRAAHHRVSPGTQPHRADIETEARPHRQESKKTATPETEKTQEMYFQTWIAL
jgi:SRSO17 transposase